MEALIFYSTFDFLFYQSDPNAYFVVSDKIGTSEIALLLDFKTNIYWVRNGENCQMMNVKIYIFCAMY